MKVVPLAELDTDKLTPAHEGGRSLLILGRASAGKGWADVAKLAGVKNVKIIVKSWADMAKLAGMKNVTVIVLDADWFGDSAGPVDVSPAQMRDWLADIARQRWPAPLKFSSHRRPWPGIVNRWAWIADDAGLPLVEQVQRFFAPEGASPFDKFGNPNFYRQVILSYLPWEQQLGRCEVADATFLTMLAASAKAGVISFDSYHGYVVTVWPVALQPSGVDWMLRGKVVLPSKERPIL